METKEILSIANSKMEKAVEVLRRSLASIRTGRASPALLDWIKVDYFGTSTPINQLATVSSPESRLLIINPWDRSLLPAIEKAILKSDLGLTPINDGRVIRLPIPPLTEERRRELVKLVRRRLEEGRIAIRNIRRDGLEEVRKAEREKALSQDESRRAAELIQKLTENFMGQIDLLGREKELEIMEE